MRKRMGSLLLTLLLVASMAGGTTVQAQTEEKVTVSFYTWASDAEEEIDRAIIAKYEEEHPNVDVEENFIPYVEYISKINTMMAADSMPDMFQLPEMTTFEWGSKDVLLDLGPLYEEAGIDPHDTILSGAIYDDDTHLWGVGYNFATIFLFYNKEMLSENGIEFPSGDASDPWTWEEFVDAAKKLTKDVNGNTPNDEGFDPQNIVAYGTTMPTAWNCFMPLLYSNGAAIASADGTELMINSPEGIEVIQAIADLSLVEHCAPDVGTAQGAFADTSTMLMNGQLAMTFNGGWSIGNFVNEGFDVGVASVPAFASPANMSWTAGFSMSPDAADKPEAFDFFLYYTDYKNVIDTANSEGLAPAGLPHTTNIYEVEENFENWVHTYSGIDATDICMTAKSILTSENTRMAESATLKNFSKIVDNTLMPALDNVWLGNSTAEEVLKGLDLTADLQGVWREEK